MINSHELTKQLGKGWYPVENYVGSTYWGSIEVRTESTIENFTARYTLHDDTVISGFGKTPFEALADLIDGLEYRRVLALRSLSDVEHGIKNLKFYFLDTHHISVGGDRGLR